MECGRRLNTRALAVDAPLLCLRKEHALAAEHAGSVDESRIRRAEDAPVLPNALREFLDDTSDGTRIEEPVTA